MSPPRSRRGTGSRPCGGSTEPCRDLAQLEQLLRALAARCGAAYVPATEALVSVPGSKNTRISPVHDVACVTWELGRRYAVGALVLP